MVRLLPVSQDQLRASILDDTLNEIGRRRCVHRHNHSTAEKDGPETRNPFRGVASPEQHAIARADSAFCKHRIRHFFPAVPAALHDGNISGEASKIVEQSKQTLSRHKRLSFLCLDQASILPPKLPQRRDGEPGIPFPRLHASDEQVHFLCQFRK